MYIQARDLIVNELLEKAGEHLCRRYGLREVECSYGEYQGLRRVVVHWKYE